MHITFFKKHPRHKRPQTVIERVFRYEYTVNDLRGMSMAEQGVETYQRAKRDADNLFGVNNWGNLSVKRWEDVCNGKFISEVTVRKTRDPNRP